MEFALVLPVLMLILLFAIDIGRAYNSWVILQNASRIGADYAALNPEGWEGSGSPAVKTEYADLVTDDWGSLDCDLPPAPVFTDGADTSGVGQTPDTNYDVGDTVRVSLTCPFRPLTPIIAVVVGNTVQFGASSEFRIRVGDIAGLTNPAQIPPPAVAPPVVGPPPPVCIVVPDLTLGAGGGSETVAQARAEWSAAGFTGAFAPSGQNTKIVTGQTPAGGACMPATTTMTVTHT